MTTVSACRACGTEPRAGVRFCDGCGSPIQGVGIRAEYKQVTVLFADVVHSMDIAAAVGAERLREIMAQYGTQGIEEVTWPQGYAFIENATQRALGLCYFPASGGSGGVIEVWLESGIGGFFPIIWSGTFEPEHYVSFKTGTYLAQGISHLHWSNLNSGSVRLVGTWSDY
jgi:hypothetical protein